MSEPDLYVQCFGQAVVLMRELRHISREGFPKVRSAIADTHWHRERHDQRHAVRIEGNTHAGAASAKVVGIAKKGLKPHRSVAAKGDKMDLRCPKCSSTDLKKASLAYQEGFFHVASRTRMLGFLFARGGADVIVGRATTSGVQQSALSRRLAPPTKWSYLKLIPWSAGTSFVALVAYVRVVMTSPPPVSSLPVKIYFVVAPLAFIFLFVSIWRHNHSSYQRQYAEWDQSFVCERCGAVSSHDFLSGSPS